MRQSGKRVVLIVMVVAVALCAAAFFFDRYALDSTYARVPDSAVSLRPTYELYEKEYPRTDEQFQMGECTLRGHVYGADNERGLIVFRHGLFSQHQDYLPFITAMVDKGWRVFAYDAIGCGESDGESVLGMSQSPLDVVAAVGYAREAHLGDGVPLVLWGHSWGGYGVAAALGKLDGVDACVSMSGFDTPMKVLDSSATASYGLLGKLQWPFLWANTVIDFGDDANLSASDAIAASGVPTLVIHGASDTTVPYDDASILGALRANWKGLEGDTLSLVTMDVPGRDGHNNYFYAPESKAYLDECVQKLQDMLDENGDDVQADDVQSFMASVDLRKANTADPELMATIDQFLGEHLGAKER